MQQRADTKPRERTSQVESEVIAFWPIRCSLAEVFEKVKNKNTASDWFRFFRFKTFKRFRFKI